MSWWRKKKAAPGRSSGRSFRGRHRSRFELLEQRHLLSASSATSAASDLTTTVQPADKSSGTLVAPTISLPTQIAPITNDYSTQIDGVWVSDPGASLITVTLSVEHGTLSLATGYWENFNSDMQSSGFSISGEGTSSITLTGTASQIYDLLDVAPPDVVEPLTTTPFTATASTAASDDVVSGLMFTPVGPQDSVLQYTPTTGYAGNDVLTVSAYGTGGASTSPTATAKLLLDDQPQPNSLWVGAYSATLLPTGDGPTGTVQFNTSSPIEDAPAGINPIEVTVSASYGTLTLNGTTGLTVTGSGTDSLSLTGSVTEIDEALNGMTYTPGSDFIGSDTLQITANNPGYNPQHQAQTTTGSVQLQAKWITAPGNQNFGTAGSLAFNAANGNAISVADFDAAGGNLELEVDASYGTFKFGETAGLTWINNTKNGGDVLIVEGTAAALNSALATLVYTPSADAPSYGGKSWDQVSVGVEDLGGDASPTDDPWKYADVNVSFGPNNTPTASAPSTPPSITAPLGQTVGLGTAVTFSNAAGNAIVINDPAAGNTVVNVTLTVNDGTLKLAEENGLTIQDGTDGSSNFDIEGTVAAINAALDGLVYTPNAGFAGVDSLWLGYQGVGANGVNYADANILIDEGANNVGVPINAPIPVQTATPTAPVVFSSAGGNAISLSNPGITATTPVQLTLSIGDGALALAETSGISIISGASGSSSLTIQGTIADINAALDGMTYTPAAADVGWTNLDLAASVLGNSSFGTTFNSVLIHDQLAFVPAAITVPATQAPSSTTPLVFSSAGGNAVSINDPAATGNVQVTLGVSSGSLSLGSTQGVVITAGANGTGSITLSGTQAAINAALDGLKYTITYGTTNDDTLTISLTDPGDSALGTVEASVAIDPVFPPSDDLFWSDSPSSSTVLPAPVVTLPSGSLPLTGTPAPVTGISVAGAALVEVTISVQNGVLNASKTTGVQIDDAGTASIELTGTVANVNAALATLVYTGNAGFVGTDSLSVSATAIAELPPPPDVLNGAGLPLGGPITNPIGVPVYPIGGPITTPIGGPIGIYNGGTPFTSTSGNLTTGTSTVATNVSTASVSTASVSTTSVSTASTSDIVTFPPLNEFEYSALPNEWSTDTSSATTATLSLLVGPPTINVPAPQKISGLLPLVFSTAGGNAISVTDSAVGNSPIQVTLSVASGTLTLASSSGLTFSGGTGTGNKTMTFTGDVSDVAAALDGLSYSANAGFSGTDTLNISVDDLGNGGGGPITVSDSVAIHVARTTAPTITISLPTSAYAVTPAGGSLPGVSISESGSNDIVQVTLSVKNGVLSTQGNGYSTLSDGTTIDTVANWPIGQTVTVTGVGTSTLVMTGSAAEIDALLEVQNPPPSQRLYSPGGQLILTLAPSSGLVYTPNSGFTGSDTLTVSAKDAVLANAPRTVSSVALNVRPPTINAPSTQTMADTAPLVFSSAEGNAISITQGNVGAGTIQVSLSVAHGTLSLASTAGLNFSLGTGTGNAAMTFTGNATDVNAALAGLSYSAGSGFTGTDKLVISVGTPGGSAPVSDSVSICVQPGPAPTVPISLPTAPVTIPAVGSQISGLTVGDLGFGPTSSLGNAQITFSVLNGTLTLPEGDGLSITGNGTSSITVTGQAGALDTDFCTSILTTMLPGSTPGRLIGFGEGPEGLFYTPNAGYSGADTLTVTTRSLLVENAPTTTATLALNDLAAVAPVVTASGTQATFTLGGSPAVVDPGIQVASTNTLLSGATITISPSTYQATDTLSFTPTGSIYGIYNNGVLTLAGIATPAEYQTALQSVTFGTGSTNSAARSISIVVLDASLSSNTASEQVLIAGGSSGTSSKQSSTTGLHGSGSSTGSPAVAHGNHSIGSLGMLSSSSGGHNSLSLDGKSTGPAPVDYNYLPPSQTSSVAVTVSPGSGSSSAGTAHQASSKKSLGALDQVFAGLEPDDLL